MIRREVAARDGTPAAWLIIAQIDHAHLAGQLAEHWGAAPFSSLRPRDSLLWAACHHDDGWAAWDQHPDVNPATGIPRQFTEMEPVDTRTIWTLSIDAAAARGPLEGYLVAGHFCRLGRRATAGKEHDANWQPFINFLDNYEASAQTWLADLRATDASHTPQLAEQALDQLQFFDTFSLWFCCSESTEREVVETPSGNDLSIVPRSSSHLHLAPWPFTADSLELSVPGRLVPAGRYASREELAAAPSQSVRLRWKLTPQA
jgi:hypothetical protein